MNESSFTTIFKKFYLMACQVKNIIADIFPAYSDIVTGIFLSFNDLYILSNGKVDL